MLSSLARKVEAFVRERELLAGDKRVMVAFSGGPDSLALLCLLDELRERLRLDLSAFHVNHRLRGADSDADEEFAARFCDERGIPLGVARLSDETVSGKGNLESVVRRLRYDILARAAARRDAVAATGHTLNDQAETLLMRLFRGSGPGGLSGIASRRLHLDPETGRAVRVIRPLLDVPRSEVLRYLAEAQLDYRVDATNLDSRYDRNWVRLDLIPRIEERLNPRLLRVLQRTTDLFREIDAFLAATAASRMDELGESSPEAVLLCVRRLAELPAALRKAMIREAFGRVRGDLGDLVLAHAEAVLDLLDNQSGRQVHLPGGLSATREFDRLRIGRRKEVSAFRYTLSLPGEISIPEIGRRVVARMAAEGPAQFRTSSANIIVRNRRPGDRYRPAPGAGEKRLKKLLIERRIPVSRRDRLLVFEGDGRILWVEGFPDLASPEVRGLPVRVRVVDETFPGAVTSNR